VRVTTAFSRLLDLPGVWVKKVRFEADRVVVTVALRRRKLQCPRCSYSTWHRESRQHHDSVWRHLDLGVWRLEIRCRLRRLRCPEHGALVEGVPFARYRALFTRDFDDLVAWLCDQDRSDRDLPADEDRLGDGRTGDQARRRGAIASRPAHEPVQDLDGRGRVARGMSI
jgi:transposase